MQPFGAFIELAPGIDGLLHVSELGDGKRLALSSDAPTELSTSLKVVDDNSYRVALVDREGMGNSGETEYFIRTLEDRPPDVRVLKPATDRSVTRLEEVDIKISK